MEALGISLSIELYDCNRKMLNDVHVVERLLKEAALEAKATIVNSMFHPFSPYGVSGVVIIAESHLAIHTWPEYGYAAIDIFTCGSTIDPWIICHYLEKNLQAGYCEANEHPRGRSESLIKHSLKENMPMPEYIRHKPLERIIV